MKFKLSFKIKKIIPPLTVARSICQLRVLCCALRWSTHDLIGCRHKAARRTAAGTSCQSKIACYIFKSKSTNRKSRLLNTKIWRITYEHHTCTNQRMSTPELQCSRPKGIYPRCRQRCCQIMYKHYSQLDKPCKFLLSWQRSCGHNRWADTWSWLKQNHSSSCRSSMGRLDMQTIDITL